MHWNHLADTENSRYELLSNDNTILMKIYELENEHHQAAYSAVWPTALEPQQSWNILQSMLDQWHSKDEDPLVYVNDNKTMIAVQARLKSQFKQIEKVLRRTLKGTTDDYFYRMDFANGTILTAENRTAAIGAIKGRYDIYDMCETFLRLTSPEHPLLLESSANERDELKRLCARYAK